MRQYRSKASRTTPVKPTLWLIVELVCEHGIFLFDPLQLFLLPLDKLQKCVHLRRFAIRLFNFQVCESGALLSFERGTSALVSRSLGLHEFFVQHGHASLVSSIFRLQLFLLLRTRLVLVVVGESVDR